MLEANDNVVSPRARPPAGPRTGSGQHDDVAMGMALPPLIRPLVEDVMQVDVASSGEITAPGACPGEGPFADQSDHPPVADAMLDKTDQPVAADPVEDPRDVGVQYPVHPSLVDPDRQRIQRIAGRIAAAGPPPRHQHAKRVRQPLQPEKPRVAPYLRALRALLPAVSRLPSSSLLS